MAITRSTFNPDNNWTVDTFLEHIDSQFEDLADIRRIQELKTKYMTPAEEMELSALCNKHRNKLWLSEDLNKVQDCLVQLQQFFRDNTIPQLEQFKGELRAERDGAVVVINDEEAKALAELQRLMEEYTQIVIEGQHTHLPNEIIGIATVAKTGSYNDLSDKPDVSSSGHKHQFADIEGKPTSYPPSSHTHDDRYYTEAEINTQMSGKSNTSHAHDDRYYTEGEMDVKLNGKSNTGHAHSIAEVNGLQGEIDGLKSSVVNGKQTMVNAINGKAGFNTGLTVNNTFSDYAWHISNSIPTYSENLIIQRYARATMDAIDYYAWDSYGGVVLPGAIKTTYNTAPTEMKSRVISVRYVIVIQTSYYSYDSYFTLSDSTRISQITSIAASGTTVTLYKINNRNSIFGYGTTSSSRDNMVELVEITDSAINFILGK